MRRAPRSSAATRPGPRPAADSAAHADRSRCASASAASIRRGPCPPASATSGEPPPPPPTMLPERAHQLRGVGRRRRWRATIATLAPSGEPPSTTARTPSWRRTAWARARRASRLDVVPAGHHDAAVGRRRRGQRRRPRPRSTAGAAWPAPSRPRAGVRSAARWPPAARRARCAAARRPPAPAARARAARSRDAVPGHARRCAGCSSRWTPPTASVIGPIWPSESTWVPPQNSSEVGPARTTRTDVAVLVAEEGDGAHRSASSARRLGRLDLDVGQHGVVGQREDLVELLAGRLAVVGEVEAQVVGRDQRALLAHVVAEHRPQRARAAGGSPCGCAGWPRGGPRRWWPARPGRPDLAGRAAPGARSAPARRSTVS